MIVIRARNVCHALPIGVSLLTRLGVEEESRAGPVLVAPYPVTTMYERPQERVLFSPVRDANPFFHLAEALWMLAGREDATFLDRFISDYSQRFAEKDGTQHGAYGRRWRHAWFDQLDYIVGMLRHQPTTRQAVLQMWEGMHLSHDDLRGNWKDRPCNTHAYFRVRENVLDMTVCCRSNDIVWGAYGANAVHFSILQEYMAARIGVGVGTYYQVSNNYHVYKDMLNRLTKRTAPGDEHWLEDDRYSFARITARPMFDPEDDPELFDEDLATLLEDYNRGGVENVPSIRNSFLKRTAWRMLQAHKAWRQRAETRYWLSAIEADDWRIAATEWVERREAKRDAA